MANEIIISHDELYSWLSDSLDKINIEEVTNASLYSLGTSDLTYRPYLACYAFASSIPEHNLDAERHPSGNTVCKYCGHVENYPVETLYLDSELSAWGGVRVNQVVGAAYYLDKFQSLQKVKPSKKDFDIFKNVIDRILISGNEVRPRDLEKMFGKVFKSNKGQREMLIDQLGILGVLDTEKYKGFHTKYTPPNRREVATVSKIDWFFPVCWWRGKDKINLETYNFFFGRYSELMRL